jgi:hypothetical protein
MGWFGLAELVILALIDPKLLALSGDLCQMALVVIPLRVGFGLHLATLRPEIPQGQRR